jgi:hypothetical protein
MASRWVDEVSARRDLDVHWHIMSLEILNENNDVDDSYRAPSPRRRYVRVVATAARTHGRAGALTLGRRRGRGLL